jgi:hypothetical protein
MSRPDPKAFGPPADVEPPRMFVWALISVALVALAMYVQEVWPHGVLAVTLYKAHLMALGGWGGYWLDRALFPYDRPHEYLQDVPADEPSDRLADDELAGVQVTAATFGHAMIRRALIVLGCLVCVGLGA